MFMNCVPLISLGDFFWLTNYDWLFEIRGNDSAQKRNPESVKSLMNLYLIRWYANHIKQNFSKSWYVHSMTTQFIDTTWWRHQMETFTALLAICAGNSPVPGEFPALRPVTRSFDVFYLRLNKRLSKQSWGWWFETLSRPLWRHCEMRLNAQRSQHIYTRVFLLNRDWLITIALMQCHIRHWLMAWIRK